MAIAQDNTLGNLGSILQAIPGLSGAINGSSETTTNSGISSQGMSALLQQILSGTGGLASVAGGQNTAGMYNSTVQQQSVNDLLTRSAGEVATKGPTSSTAVKAPTLNLGDTLLQGAAGLIGTKILSKGVDTLGSTVSDALGLSGSTQAGSLAAGSALSSAATGGSTAGAFTAGGAIPESVANAGIAGSAASEASAGAAGISGASTGVAAGEGGIGLTGAGALDAGLGAGLGLTGAGVGAATAGGLAAGGATLGGLGGAIAGDVAASTAGIAAGAGVGAGAAAGAAGGIGDALAAALPILAWVVCTELESAGEMSHVTYQKAAPDFVARMHLKPSAVRGYHYWAVPYTRIMRRRDWIGRLARICIRPLANGRAAMIAGRWNLLGAITFQVLEPICSLLGNTIARKPQNWKSLYTGKE